MRRFLGLTISLSAVSFAAYVIFSTVFGSHIASMLGIGIFSLGKIELSLVQPLGIQSLSYLNLIYFDCILLGLVAAWHIVINLRDFDDLFYKTLLNGGLGMLAASALWVFKQAMH